MLPEQLSTDLTSLNEGADRLAVLVSIVVAGDGSISSTGIDRALMRNRVRLTAAIRVSTLAISFR